MTDPAQTGERYCPACDRSFGADLLDCPNDGTRLVVLPRAFELETGHVIDDRYVIEARIGAGGMGTVYAARQRSLDRVVAVKVVNPWLAGEPTAVKRILREARLLSRLLHPNIVTVVDFGQSRSGTVYLVMELLRGVTLSALLRRVGPLPAPRAVRIATQICDALAAAHAVGIVHCDLTPPNIMVLDEPADRDFVKVLDFGLAKPAADGDTSRVTRAGTVAGTPAFIPPEVVEGGAPDARSDLFSLGVLCHRMLTGRLPESIRAPLHSELVPPVLASVVDRLREPLRSARIATADLARDALLAAAEQASAASQAPASLPAPSAAIGSDLVTIRAPTTSGRRRLVLGAGIAAAALLGAAVIALSRRDDTAGLGAHRGRRDHMDRPSGPTGGLANDPRPAALGEVPAPLSLEPQAGVVLRIRSEPQATVDLDGRALGPTPVETRVDGSPASRRLTWRRPGYETVTRSLVVEGGPSPREVSVRLRPRRRDSRPRERFLVPP